MKKIPKKFLAVFFNLFITSIFAGNATEVIKVNPYSNPHLQIVNKNTGYCWISSLATHRADAWRCMSGNIIFDPCFSQKYSTQVICVQRPDTHNAILLHLTRPLPKLEPSLSSDQPWSVQFMDGSICGFMTGATGVINSMRINYGCTSSLYILGDINTRAAYWIANVYNNKTKEMKKVRIKKAWY